MDDSTVNVSRTGLLWALLVLGAVGFVAFAALYDREPFLSLDGEVAVWVATDLPGWLEALARPFSWLGGWIGLTALGVAAVVLLAHERNWLDLGFFLAAFAGTQIGVALLKNTFDRLRPEEGSAVPLPESFAFPSGHAAAGVASLGALAVLAAERLPSARARSWLWVAAVLAGLAVGLSRIALNVHFVTDVLAGWCFGLAWLAACLLVRGAARGRTKRNPATGPATLPE